MNEQIKQLANQCWDKRLDGMHFDQEKFAELIVKECVSICKDRERPNLYGVREVETTIKQHFGIEE